MKARITYVGHATTLVEMNGIRILTDPVLRNRLWFLLRNGPKVKEDVYSNIDAVIISHAHKDHFDTSSLRMVGKDAKIIAPRGIIEGLRKRGFGDRKLVGIGEGESTRVETVSIKAVPANHSNSFKPLITRTDFLGYIIEGNRRVYFPGDTDVFTGMRKLGRIDVALLPVWGWGPTLGPGHMNPRRASEALGLLKPRVAIPIHWGTLQPLGMGYLGMGFVKKPPLEFKEFARKYPDVDVRILKPGEKTEIV